MEINAVIDEIIKPAYYMKRLFPRFLCCNIIKIIRRPKLYQDALGIKKSDSFFESF